MGIEKLLSEIQDVVLLFGPPCGGKGTVSKELVKTGNFYHVSTGDLFRNMAKYDKALAEKVKPAFDGVMIEDATTIECLTTKLVKDAATGAYVPEKQVLLLDGFPRTVPQSKYALDHFNIWRVLNITANQATLWKRMFERHEKEGRKDDNIDDFEKRLNDYHTLSVPAMNEFPKDLIRTIDTTMLTEKEVGGKAFTVLGLPRYDSVSSDIRELFEEAAHMPVTGRTVHGKIPGRYDIAANHEGQVRAVYKSPNPE